MQNWHDNVLRLIAEIDRCIRAHEGETLTLAYLARLLDCSQSQVSHTFATTRASVTGILCKSRLAFPEKMALQPHLEQRHDDWKDGTRN